MFPLPVSHFVVLGSVVGRSKTRSLLHLVPPGITEQNLLMTLFFAFWNTAAQVRRVITEGGKEYAHVIRVQ